MQPSVGNYINFLPIIYNRNNDNEIITTPKMVKIVQGE